jgi:glycosyltransferase involved in cell wall biosynthesis
MYFPEHVDFKNPGVGDIIRYIYNKQAAACIKRLISKQPVKLAHLHIYYGQLTSSILSPLKKAGIPIVQTLHEFKIVCPIYSLLCQGEPCEDCQGHAFWHAVIKRCNRGSLARSLLSTIESYVSKSFGSVLNIDHFIAVSDFLRNKVIELGISPEKITTVHNFIDLSNVIAGHQKGEYFIYFGRLERLKGLLTLLEASRPLKSFPLLIVGDGEMRPDIEAYVEKYSLHNIKLLGFKQGKELSDLISNSICTITPSEWHEPCPLTIFESFAHGRPVIASSIGGLPELVSHQIDGFLIQPKHIESLREKLIWMSTHRDMAVEMGLAGRKKVENKHNPYIHYEKIMSVYRKLT